MQLSGDLFKETTNYAIGIFNGSADAASTDTDNNNDKDLIARVFVHPFKNSDTQILKGLGVGVAGSYGHKEGSTLPTYRSAGQASIFTYGSGVSADGAHMRMASQFYYYYNSLGILGEFVSSEQKVVRTSGSTIRESFNNTAWQISGTYVLTGEDATYKGVIPRRAFDLKEGGWGAFALVGRYGRLDVDDSIFETGFASLSTAISRADSWGLGVNWYLNRNLRLSLDFEQTEYEAGAQNSENRPTENVVFSRFQVSY